MRRKLSPRKIATWTIALKMIGPRIIAPRAITPTKITPQKFAIPYIIAPPPPDDCPKGNCLGQVPSMKVVFRVIFYLYNFPPDNWSL